jgi:adenosylcobinamide kinase / adenosylcobinamide-phosphate guanylyltransferase
MKKVTLITGGARSGKSAHALALAPAEPGARRYFIATADALDDEMRERIAHHRRSRGADIATVEEPRDVAGALERLAGHADFVIVDCLTLWISNLMNVYPAENYDAFHHEARVLAEALAKAPYSTVVVTDEVGYGIVPNNPLARRFRDLLGWTNQRIAQSADEVILMVAGIPMRVK